MNRNKFYQIEKWEIGNEDGCRLTYDITVNFKVAGRNIKKHKKAIHKYYDGENIFIRREKQPRR